ncbi:MAG: GIY-YIG nuclease family protein [Elusimicrobia bacterium]|nr:GIY-YIG nuclease family protein [Elusimicrobiota bacterium]
MYYVYLLGLKDATLYTGRSSDLKRRIEEHNRGKVESTRHKLPAKLIYYEAYSNEQDATDRELYLKSGDGRREVRKQLKHSLQ